MPEVRDVVVASAPGRVNLIGEHLDYNGGRCLPIAIPQRTTATVRRSAGDLQVASTVPDGEPYVAAVMAALGVRDGLEVSLTSDVPVGAGLSSSAALECSVALAVDGLLELGLPRDRLRQACIAAETEHLGAPTGGLDQTAAFGCEAGQALLVDFATGSRRPVRFDPGAAGLVLLVVDTGVSHAHVDGGYGGRRAECDEARRLLGVPLLVQADPTDLARLPATLQPRLRHVLTEQARVRQFVAAVEVGDWTAAGGVLSASHASLRDDFAVSCPELDAVVEVALAHGALGARMTGGGFGGSAMVLLPEETVAPVDAAVRAEFTRNGWEAPTLFGVEASPGARVESVT